MIRNRFNTIFMGADLVVALLKKPDVTKVGTTRDGGIFVHVQHTHSVVFYNWEPHDLVMARYQAVSEVTRPEHAKYYDSSSFRDTDMVITLTEPGDTTGSEQAYRFSTFTSAINLKGRDD